MGSLELVVKVSHLFLASIVLGPPDNVTPILPRAFDEMDQLVDVTIG
jgi:hypothetical protein